MPTCDSLRFCYCKVTTPQRPLKGAGRGTAKIPCVLCLSCFLGKEITPLFVPWPLWWSSNAQLKQRHPQDTPLSSTLSQCTWYQWTISSLSYLAPCCCDKDHDQSKLGEERASFNLQVIVFHGGRQRQELTAVPKGRSRDRRGVLLMCVSTSVLDKNYDTV